MLLYFSDGKALLETLAGMEYQCYVLWCKRPLGAMVTCSCLRYWCHTSYRIGCTEATSLSTARYSLASAAIGIKALFASGELTPKRGSNYETSNGNWTTFKNKHR